MKKKGRRSEKRRIIDTGIFCTAVLMLFFAVILFVQEYEYVPQEVYVDPPPAPPMSTPVQNGKTSAYVPYTPYSAIPIPSEPAVTAAQTEQVYMPTDTPQHTAEPVPSPTEKQTHDAVNTPAPAQQNELIPVKLYFVERRISCDILPVGINSKYEMGTIRSPYNAGWLKSSPYVLPGDTGKAIIAGHNRWNGHNGTFSILKKMSVGETVAVEMNDGYARYFRVDELTECAYDDNSIMEPVYDRAVLVLITCKGDWDSVLHTSRTRVIAICSPIG